MKRILFVTALLVTVVALGDEMATSICVVEKSAYDGLLKKWPSVTKVPVRDLWKASAHRGYIGEDSGDSLSAEFTLEGKKYGFLAKRLKRKIIYSITSKPKKGDPQLLAAGTIMLGQEVKGDVDEEEFVVVTRKGNFLSK